MDVRLPDGTVIKGVPDDMSKADLTAKLKSNGYDVSKLEAPSSGIPTTRQDVDQFGIPGKVRPAEPDAPRSLFQRAMGNIETIPALAAGAVGGVVTPIAQLGYELTQGQAFTPEGKAAAAKFGQQVQGQFYQPRTPEAQRNVQAIGEAVIPLAGLRIGGPTNALAPATRAIRDVARSEGSLISGSVNQMAAKRAAATQNTLAAQSYARAPIIDAAQAANRTGLVVNPAITNPTVANKAKGLVVGPAFEDAAVKVNAGKTRELVRKDLGLSSTDPLDTNAIESALKEAGKPYDTVRKIPKIIADKNTFDALESLKKTPSAVSKGKVETSNALIDSMIEEIKQGRSGADVLDDIRQLRAEANSVYKARDKGLIVQKASDIAEADARMGIANAYEKMIDANVIDPKLLAEIKTARVRMAQIYDHDRAINYANETIDPQAYAKMLNERKGNMSGVGADIGKVAATFPEVMSTQSPTAQVMPAVKRSGLGAAGGALIGGAVGGYPGAIAGATMGGTLGWAGTQGLAKGMTKAEYQAARAVPKDYRNKLAPANSKTNALAP